MSANRRETRRDVPVQKIMGRELLTLFSSPLNQEVVVPSPLLCF